MASHSTEISFPHVLAIDSDPFERGREVGRQTAREIHRSIAIYEQVFAYYAQVRWPRVRELAARYVDPIADYDQATMREIEGISDGAGLPLQDVVALNARSEIMFGAGAPAPQECTAFFVAPPASRDGEVLLGENWDWLTRCRECTVLLELGQGAGRPSLLTLAEAGQVAKVGLNSEGIGVTVNAMQSSADSDAPCVPVHVILRGILNARTFEDAVAAVTRAARGASATYTIAGADGRAIAIEGGPGGAEAAYELTPVNGVISHCNHFLAEVEFTDTGVAAHPDSLDRLDTIGAFLDAHRGELSATLLKQVLGNEGPGPICRRPDPSRHPAEDVSTLASLIMNLGEGRIEIADGPPAGRPYQTIVPEFTRRRR